ncbi:MAG: DUF3499 domain-containing protein [Varibaculum sp.]|nr:DUF3499 domain-containing protein [Varibaculum sp.]
MTPIRTCSKHGCTSPAAATLTYAYSSSTVVLGPLAAKPDPHAYDLCSKHAESFKAPRGWEVVRLADSFIPSEPSEGDLEVLADLVRAASRHPEENLPEPADPQPSAPVLAAQTSKTNQVPGVFSEDALRRSSTGSARRAHLRVYQGGGGDAS